MPARRGSYGLDLEIISGNALRDRFPFIGPEVRAGSYSPRDGHANPRLAAPAFGRAAKRAGAAVFENTEIVVVRKGRRRLPRRGRRRPRLPRPTADDFRRRLGQPARDAVRRAGAAGGPRPANGRDRAAALRDSAGAWRVDRYSARGRLSQAGEAREYRVRRRQQGTGQRGYVARLCAAGKHALAVHADFAASCPR